jgi:hypothetical protein
VVNHRGGVTTLGHPLKRRCGPGEPRRKLHFVADAPLVGAQPQAVTPVAAIASGFSRFFRTSFAGAATAGQAGSQCWRSYRLRHGYSVPCNQASRVPGAPE